MLTSWKPRTSPTFQSVLVLSACVLWQATQGPPMITGAIRRTRSVVSDSWTSAIVRSGSARSCASDAASKASSSCGLRLRNAWSETNR